MIGDKSRFLTSLLCGGGIALILVLARQWHSVSWADEVDTKRNPSIAQEVAPKEQSLQTKLLRHVVLFQFKQSSSSEQVDRIVRRFAELKTQISVIRDFEYGTNNSPEGLDQGLSHCFLVTFHSEQDRDVYLKHPAHQAFVELLLPHLEKATVVDYWANH